MNSIASSYKTEEEKNSYITKIFLSRFGTKQPNWERLKNFLPNTLLLCENVQYLCITFLLWNLYHKIRHVLLSTQA